MFGSKLSIPKFLSLLPELGALIGDIVTDLENDHKIDKLEAAALGEKLIVLIQHLLTK